MDTQYSLPMRDPPENNARVPIMDKSHTCANTRQRPIQLRGPTSRRCAPQHPPRPPQGQDIYPLCIYSQCAQQEYPPEIRYHWGFCSLLAPRAHPEHCTPP
uniref:Uncharacterized protein n=1 Tax=Xenopus tropicalis TaxID=8364 RepID=A0A1B8Y0Z3_XENTR